MLSWVSLHIYYQLTNISSTFYQHELLLETAYDKTNKMACAPSEDSDQPGHPRSLIRDFVVLF